MKKQSKLKKKKKKDKKENEKNNKEIEILIDDDLGNVLDYEKEMK